MNVLEIIPIARSTRVETLSYFTSEHPPVGAIVEAPLRGKTVHGIVVAVQPAASIKADLKTASFALKKIERVKARKFLSPALVQAAAREAEYAATSVGAALKAMVHESILEESDNLITPYSLALKNAPKKTEKESTEKEESGAQKMDQEKDSAGATLGDESGASATTVKNDDTKTDIFASPPSKETDSIAEERRAGGVVYALQGDDEERWGSYRSMIRQEFARRKSLLFLVPTAEEAEHLRSVLEKGIEKYIFVLHGNLTPKRIREVWNAAAEEPHSVVVVATGPFMAFARADLDTLILERESVRGWKGQRRPYLDLRHAIETYADRAGYRLFIGDVALRLETSRRQDQGQIDRGSPFKARSVSPARDTLVDMRTYKGAASFRILSEKVEELIRKTREDNANMVIVAARKGLAPSTVCGDCHTIVTCNTCGSPVVLHESKTLNAAGEPETYFLCHHCGERRSTEEYCKVCGSWKLGTVGIGIDLVRKKIADQFPDAKVFQLDSDVTPTPKKIHETIAKFRANPGSILLGTELLINHFHDKVAYSAVITLDSLLALPDFRISERVFYMLVRLRALTEREIVVQTRTPEERAFEFAVKGNITDFVRSALDERKQFDWPPYSTLIKLSIEGKRDQIAAEMERIKGFLAPQEIDVFPSFTAAGRGNSLLHGLIRLSPGSWPTPELAAKLRSLPPQVSVNVDPESLL